MWLSWIKTNGAVRWQSFQINHYEFIVYKKYYNQLPCFSVHYASMYSKLFWLDIEMFTRTGWVIPNSLTWFHSRTGLNHFPKHFMSVPSLPSSSLPFIKFIILIERSGAILIIRSKTGLYCSSPSSLQHSIPLHFPPKWIWL